MSLDLFGKQAKLELEAVREKLNALEFRHSDVVAKYSAINEELRESKAQTAAINISKRSLAQYEESSKEHDRQTAQLKKGTLETAAKEAALMSKHHQQLATMQQEHERKTGTLQSEHDLLATKVSQLQKENAAAGKKIEVLGKEIDAGKKQREKHVIELDRLVASRSKIEAEFKAACELRDNLSRQVAGLATQQELIIDGNSFVQQAVAQFERSGSKDERFALMLQDLQQYETDDKTGGALQLNLDARPLLLVIDMGLEQTALALVRGGKSFSFEAKGILKIGGATFEKALAKWLQVRFAAQHPSFKQVNASHFLPSARRLFALLCQGIPQGDIEETINFGNHPYTVILPLKQEQLAPLFRTLLGPEGSVLPALRQFLNNSTSSATEIDRIVCLGVFSRLPLLREALADALRRPVLLPRVVPTTIRTVGISGHVKGERHQQEAVKIKLVVVKSDPEREKREREEKERKEKEEWVRLEREQRANREAEVKRIAQLNANKAFIYKDPSTGLIWTRNGNLSGKKMHLKNAEKWVNRLEYAGYSDWILPTKEELEAFAKSRGGRPSVQLNANGFNGVQPSSYWSSTYESDYGNDYELTVNFNDGSVDGSELDVNFESDDSCYVWPVRGRNEDY